MIVVVCSNTTYFSKEKVIRIPRLKLKPYHLWSSACWSGPFGGKWRTIDVISRGALKSRQQTWDLYLHGAILPKTYDYREKAHMYLTHPFFSLLESHCPHSGGVPILSQIKHTRKWFKIKGDYFTVHYVNLALRQKYSQESHQFCHNWCLTRWRRTHLSLSVCQDPQNICVKPLKQYLPHSEVFCFFLYIWLHPKHFWKSFYNFIL